MKKMLILSLLTLSIFPAFAVMPMPAAAMDVDESGEAPQEIAASRATRIKKWFSNNKKRLGATALVWIFTGGIMANALNVGYSANDSVMVQVAFPFNATLPEDANGCTYHFAHDCEDVINEDQCETFLHPPTEMMKNIALDDTVIIGECEVEFLDKRELGLGLGTAVSQVISFVPFFQGLVRSL